MTMIQRIPISRPFDNHEDLFWAGIHEHRDRRLAYLHRQQQQQQDAMNENRDVTTQSSSSSSLPTYYAQSPVYNCYNIMYTGTIEMGTPPQSFNVKLDTTTSVSWLPSERCDHTCRYGRFNKYNPYTSSTYNSIDPSLPSEFREVYKYDYSASISGTFIKDTINLGNNVSVSDYVFAEVTDYDYIAKCTGEGGRLGMGPSSSLSPTESIWDHITLQNPIFSIYLNSGDDYLSKGMFPDYTDHRSEMIFGGVDSEHYMDCIQWHLPSNVPGSQSSWNVGLRTISVSQDDNNGSISTSTIDINGFARLDTGIFGISGHPDIISQLTSALGLECFNYGLDEEGLFPVNCGDFNGFDVASIDCKSTLRPIDFTLEDGTKYQLVHDDLVKEVDVEFYGIQCFASIISDLDGARNVLTFGDVFFNHYYVAFNIETKSIGFAEGIRVKSDPTSNSSYERCDADYPYDIAYYANELNVVPGSDIIIDDPTATTPTATTPTASKASKLMNDMKVWTSKNPNVVVAATAGSFVSILILVLTILTCRRMYSHRNYKRADSNDDTMTSKPRIADETELPDLI